MQEVQVLGKSEEGRRDFFLNTQDRRGEMGGETCDSPRSRSEVGQDLRRARLTPHADRRWRERAFAVSTRARSSRAGLVSSTQNFRNCLKHPDHKPAHPSARDRET